MKQAMTGSKAKSAKPMATAKKPMRQVETSMSKKYKGTPKVSFKTIDDIKKMGMTAALKKAGTSKNPEYLEGIRRMYGAKRLAAAQGGAKKAPARSYSPAQKSAMGAGAAKKAAPAPKKNAPLSAAGYKAGAGANGGYPVKPSTKKKAAYKAPEPTAQQKAQAKARAGGNSAKYTPGAGR